jgi:hypothetical protein
LPLLLLISETHVLPMPEQVDAQKTALPML